MRLLQGDVTAAARWADRLGRDAQGEPARHGVGRPVAGPHRWRGSGSPRAGPRTPGGPSMPREPAATAAHDTRRPHLDRGPRRRARGGDRATGRPRSVRSRPRSGWPHPRDTCDAWSTTGAPSPTSCRPSAGSRRRSSTRSPPRSPRCPRRRRVTGRRTGPSLWQDEHGQPLEALTARELEVLRLMARGSSDAAIARRARGVARDRQVARRPHPLEARGEEPDPGAAAGPGARAGLAAAAPARARLLAPRRRANAAIPPRAEKPSLRTILSAGVARAPARPGSRA